MSAEIEGVVGYFAAAEELPPALERARKELFADVEAYAPVGEHALGEAAMPGGSLVRYIAVGGGLTGMVVGMGMPILMSINYPLVTGGKPIVSLPPFVIIAFELMVLLAVLGALFGFFVLTRPKLTPSPAYNSNLAVDTFAVFIRTLPESLDRARAAELLRECGAYEVRDVIHHERGLMGELA